MRLLNRYFCSNFPCSVCALHYTASCLVPLCLSKSEEKYVWGKYFGQKDINDLMYICRLAIIGVLFKALIYSLANVEKLFSLCRIILLSWNTFMNTHLEIPTVSHRLNFKGLTVKTRKIWVNVNYRKKNHVGKVFLYLTNCSSIAFIDSTILFIYY